MDASVRAELDSLRIRAYGPDADIDADPTALSRLSDLEETVRFERGADVPTDAQMLDPPSSHAGPVIDVGPPSMSEVVDAPSRRGWERTVLAVFASAAVAVVATVAVLQVTPPVDTAPATVLRADFVDVREAYWFVNDLDSDVLMRIMIDDVVGSDGALSSRLPASSFPTSGTITWVEPLGEFFGWNLWVASAAGAIQEEHCLLIERNGVTRARCVVASLRSQSALLAPVSYRDIPSDERAGVLADGERIGFWWRDNSEVTLLVGPEPRRWGE
ncbi:hypothetical protein LG299_08920 [Microbacterium lacus]|uniref:hypothetical protein n=1 Tax=Microbacterium lacus TaxID=415217 RepID=UPI00384BC6A3